MCEKIDWSRPIEGCANNSPCTVLQRIESNAKCSRYLIGWDWCGGKNYAIVSQDGECCWRSFCNQDAPLDFPYVRNVPPQPVTENKWFIKRCQGHIAMFDHKYGAQLNIHDDDLSSPFTCPLTYTPKS